MKLNRSRFTHYLDILSFIILSIMATVYMLIGIGKREQTMAPSMAFVLVYLMNLIFYRLCLEFDSEHNYDNKYGRVYFLSMLYLLGILTTISLLVYLVYFASIALHDDIVIDMLKNHVFYATIVGCAFSIAIAIDNTNTLYRLYIKGNK